MPCGTDVLLRGFKQLVGNVARIGSANCLSVGDDFFGKLGRGWYRLLEHLMQKFNDEFLGSVLIVVKDYLEVAGFGVNIPHVIVPLISCIPLYRSGSRPR